MSELLGLQPVQRCAGCGTELAPSMLACPACHALVHRERLARLSADAELAALDGERERAIELWRETLSLVPAQSKQHAAISNRIDELTATVARREESSLRWKGAGAGAAIVALLAKGKLLLVGLTKLPTLLSMLAFVGVYWHLWGWQFAVAAVLGIYVHEMGHVFALSARGVPASAPMFVPGLGAFVRHGGVQSPRDHARIAVAGPLFGCGAAVAILCIYGATHYGMWAAAAHFTAELNLMNLAPIAILDGQRAFATHSRRQRWIVVGVMAAMFFATNVKMLIIVGAVALWRALQQNAPAEDDWGAFASYAGLAIALPALAAIAR